MVQAEETETKARDSDMTAAHRPVVMSDAGMVTAGHPAAAVAGAEMLRRGGNAVDAAVASAAALAVAIPHMNGLGGDVIALVYEAASGRVTTVSGGGRSRRQAMCRPRSDRGRPRWAASTPSGTCRTVS